MEDFSVIGAVVMWASMAAVFWVLWKCIRGDFHAKEPPQDPPQD